MSCNCRCHVSSGTFTSCDVGPVQPGGNQSCSPCDYRQSEMSEVSEDALLTTRDHWNAADALTKPSTRRLVRDSGHTERVPLPSLLDQLVEAIESGSGQKTGRMQASKPPLDVAAMSLLFTVTSYVRDGLRQRRIKRSFDLVKDLRALVSAVNTEGDPERVDKCTRLLRSWAGQIRATISNDPDRTWRMHGAACRVCGSVSVPVFDADGDMTHQPALVVHSEDGVIDMIRCEFCGSTLAGPDLVDIVRRAPRAVDTA